MRHLAGAIAISQALAAGHSEADRRSNDEWRRLHARPDAEPDPVPAPIDRPRVRIPVQELARRLARLAPGRTGAA